MDLTPYVEQLRRELVASAEVGGDEARALAERLTAPLESSLRLALLSALSTAAEEITSQLAPGAVDVRLRGGDLGFVVTAPPRRPTTSRAGPAAAPRLRRRSGRRGRRHGADHPPPPRAAEGPRRGRGRPRRALGQHLAGARGDPGPRTGRGRRLRRPAQEVVRPALLRLGALTTGRRPLPPPAEDRSCRRSTPPPPSRSASTSPAARCGSAPTDRSDTVVTVRPSNPQQLRRRPGRRADAGRVHRRAAGRHLAPPSPAAVLRHHAVGRHRPPRPGGLRRSRRH